MADQSASPRLTDEQIESLVARLRAGEYLDEYLRPLLFRQAKEYELDYAAKTPRSRVLADTMAVPLQRLKEFGNPSGDWTNKLVFGDNLQVLKTLLEMKSRGELLNADGTEGIRLCYLDPPFATLREFRGSRNQRAYRDKIEGAAFIEFLRKRLVLVHELLADDGVLWLHLDTRKSHYMKVVLDEIFGEHNFRNEVAWKRTSAHSDAAVMGAVHETLLLYSKTANMAWNEQFVPYEEWYVEQYYRYEDADGRKFMSGDLGAAGLQGGGYDYVWNGHQRVWRLPETSMQRLDDEARIFYTRNGMPRIKRFLDESKGQPLGDLWNDILPIVSWSDEREDYPTQKPTALLRRIVEASSAPGDLVLDCFAGSGTTPLVAETEGRRWVAVDCGKLSVYITQRRLLALGAQEDGDEVAFELYAAGLYDNDLVETLPFDGFRDFCLELFGCRAGAHTIGGIQMAGTRKGGPVHFFPFKETEAEMGREYLVSLAGRLKGRVSDEVYVVAPVTACDPGLFEDVVVVDKVTFFLLRVPYSVIEALHGRQFKLLDQPFSAEMVNDPMDTFGFDFVQLPEVDVNYRRTRTNFTGTIKAFMRGGLDPDEFRTLKKAGKLDLAMVLIDRGYDGTVFKVSDHFFGDELENDKWKFALPLAECGERVLIIYMDTHGNEFRETIEPASIKAPAKRARKGKASRKKAGASG
jgi:DNA modification methylase